MTHTDEAKRLVTVLSDGSRKAFRQGRTVGVPHKFKSTGQVITQENFNPRTDVSRLSLEHWQLLEKLLENGWHLEKAAEACQFSLSHAKSLQEKLKYFRYERAKEKAMVKTLSPDFVAAKQMENVYTDQLSDGQRDSLDKLAKITGAYKTTDAMNIQQNVFNMPQLSPEMESQFKALFEKSLETEVVKDAV